MVPRTRLPRKNQTNTFLFFSSNNNNKNKNNETTTTTRREVREPCHQYQHQYQHQHQYNPHQHQHQYQHRHTTTTTLFQQSFDMIMSMRILSSSPSSSLSSAPHKAMATGGRLSTFRLLLYIFYLSIACYYWEQLSSLRTVNYHEHDFSFYSLGGAGVGGPSSSSLPSGNDDDDDDAQPLQQQQQQQQQQRKLEQQQQQQQNLYSSDIYNNIDVIDTKNVDDSDFQRMSVADPVVVVTPVEGEGEGEEESTEKFKTNNNDKKKVAIIHVGPHKTGTTAIQSTLFSEEYKSVLENEDNFVLFPNNYFDIYVTRVCFFPNDNRIKYEIDENSSSTSPYEECPLSDQTIQESKELVHQATIHGKNIMYSNEALEHFERYNVTKMKEFFGDYEIHAVVVYRRFFEWLVSLHGWIYRNNYNWIEWPWSENGGKDPLLPLVDWFSFKEMEFQWTERYSVNTYNKFRDQYQFETSIINYHADKDIVTTFFCNKNGTQTPGLCQAKKRAVEEAENAKAEAEASLADGSSAITSRKLLEAPVGNRGVTIAYDEVVMAAVARNYIGKDTKVRRWKANFAVEYYLKKKLGIHELPKRCMDDAVADRFLEYSLEAERLLVPEFFASPEGEASLRAAFEKQRYTKFCSVDTAKLFDENPSLGKFLKYFSSTASKDESVPTFVKGMKNDFDRS